MTFHTKLCLVQNPCALKYYFDLKNMMPFTIELDIL